MKKNINKLKVEPGYVYASDEPTYFYAIIGSGIVITIFDKRKKIGGVCYFIYPLRSSKTESNPIFACPSFVGLLNMFVDYGSDFSDLEANIIGGADNYCVDSFKPGLALQNIQVAKELINIKKLPLEVVDVGGKNRGRKMIFNSLTGEILIARVNSINNEAWYPPEIGD